MTRVSVCLHSPLKVSSPAGGVERGDMTVGDGGTVAQRMLFCPQQRQ